MYDALRCGNRSAFEEEGANRVAKARERIAAVDRHSQVRPVVETLGVPGAERPQLVDDPPFAPTGGARFIRYERIADRRMPEPSSFVPPFIQQQVHVIEQELPAFLRRHVPRCAALRDVTCLAEDPGVP